MNSLTLLSAKNKILGLLAAWLLLTLLMFWFFFGLLDKSNKNALDGMSQQRKDLAVLKAERQSYEQAQADLKRLEKESFQPDNFFSRDTALVNEIQTLERLGNKLNVNMQLSGISGTVSTALKAKTQTSLVQISYNINLDGDLSQVVDFIESLENLEFITNVNRVSITAAEGRRVSANLTAYFYIKR